MKKYSDTDILRAQELRRNEKYSFSQIQKISGIPATTIRNWSHNEYIGTRFDSLLRTKERQRIELKSSELALVNCLNIDQSQAKLFVALIYWCEGSKYPASNKVTLTNSDPSLLKLFVQLLRRVFPLDEKKLGYMYRFTQLKILNI